MVPPDDALWGRGGLSVHVAITVTAWFAASTLIAPLENLLLCIFCHSSWHPIHCDILRCSSTWRRILSRSSLWVISLRKLSGFFLVISNNATPSRGCLQCESCPLHETCSCGLVPATVSIWKQDHPPLPVWSWGFQLLWNPQGVTVSSLVKNLSGIVRSCWDRQLTPYGIWQRYPMPQHTI